MTIPILLSSSSSLVVVAVVVVVVIATVTAPVALRILRTLPNAGPD